MRRPGRQHTAGYGWMLPEELACDPQTEWLSPECPADVQIQPANGAEQSQYKADDA